MKVWLLPMALVWFWASFGYAQTNSIETREKSPDADAPYHDQEVIDATDAHLEGEGLVDLVLRSTGVASRRSGLETDPSYVAIRGGNPRQTAVTWNGLRLDPPFGPGFDFGSFSPFGFDAIRVVRGGVSAEKGDGATSGTIDLGVSEPKTSNYQFGLGAASFGTWQLFAKVADRTDDAWGVVSGTHLSTDGEFDFVDAQGTERRRVGSDTDRSQVMASVGTTLSGDWAARGDLLYAEREGGAAGPSEFQESFANAMSNSTQLATRLSVDADRLSDGDAAAGAVLGFSAYELDYNNPDSLASEDGFSRRSRSRAFLTRGFYRRFIGDHLVSVAAGGTLKSFSVERASHTRAGASLQAAHEWFISRQWVLSLSAATEFVTDRDLQWSMSVASIWHASDRFQWRVGARRSSRVPDLDELHLEGETVRGNASLEDESSWDAETGVDIEVLGVDVSAVGFVRRVESTILFLPVSAFLFEAQNVDPLDVFGGELRASYRLGPAEMNGWYTFTRSLFDDGRRSPQQPEHQGGVRLGADFGVGMAFAQVTARSDLFLDTFNALRADGFVTADVGLRLSPFDHLQVAATVRNVFDDRQREDTLQRPLPGRSLHGSATVQF